MSISTASPGSKIVFRDVFGDGPDLVFDIVVWRERTDDPGLVDGYVALPGWVTLCPVRAIPVPYGYEIVGIAYCQP